MTTLLLLMTIVATDPRTGTCELAFSDPLTREEGIFGGLTYAQARDVVDLWKHAAPTMRSVIACRGEIRV